MTEVLITDRDDLRPGDLLRVWSSNHRDRWAEGPIYEGTDGMLMVCGLIIRGMNGTWIAHRFDLTAHPARREVPDLPRGCGSVVLVTRLNSTRLDKPRVSVRMDAVYEPRPWWVSGFGYHRTDEITAWTPLVVTEAGPEVTR